MTMMKVSQEGVLEKYEGQEAVAVVPEGVVKIETSAFYGNKSVREVILPDSLQEIGIGAFRKSGLQQMVIPSGVRSIEREAFADCDELHSVLLPDSLSSIESYMFKNCSKLRKLTLPEGLKEIKAEAFTGCGFLELNIPEGVTYIGRSAFGRIQSLEKLQLPKTLTGIDREAFYGCVRLEEVRLPEGMLEICWRAFGGCTALERVTFPKSPLLALDREAFAGTPVYIAKELEEACRRSNERTIYPKPRGYQKLDFGGMKFYYCTKKDEYTAHGMARGESMKQYGFVYDYSLTDSLDIYRDKKGRPVLRSYVSIPTFDSGDREWNSYAALYLGREAGACYGIYVTGGYKIAGMQSYYDVWYADSKTEKIMKQIEPEG